MKFLTTNEFWDAMCDPRFVRVNLYRGDILGERLYTFMPPELINGFLEKKKEVVLKWLAYA